MFCAVAAVAGVAVGPESITGAWFCVTVIVVVSLAESTLSLAVILSTYTPGTEKLTAVKASVALLNVTSPGPLTFSHFTVTVPGGLGRPSSMIVGASQAW